MSADDQLTAATLRALHCMVQRVRNPLPMPLAVPTPGNLRMRRAIRQLDAAVDAIVEQRLADRLPAGQPIRDMLDVLMDPTLAQPFSRKQIRDEVATFIVAGHETLASALTWAWYLLGVNPEGYLPFGAGPRLCIGRDMARMQGAQILDHIAQHWKLDPIHHQQVPIEASATLRPHGGLPMRLQRITH